MIKTVFKNKKKKRHGVTEVSPVIDKEDTGCKSWGCLA